MTTQPDAVAGGASSQFMMSSILVVSSDDDDTCNSSVVRGPLRSRNVNQNDATAKDKAGSKSKKGTPLQPRRTMLSPDMEGSHRRTSVSFTASSSIGSSLMVSSDLEGMAAAGVGTVTPSATSATASSRRRHRPRQTSFVESDGRVTPLEPPPPPSVAPTMSSSRDGGGGAGAALVNPFHPPLAPLHPSLPPAATLGAAAGPREGAKSRCMPTLPSVSGSYSLRPDLTDVEPAVPLAVVPTPAQRSHRDRHHDSDKYLPDDGPAAFNALQMTSLCQDCHDVQPHRVPGHDEDADDGLDSAPRGEGNVSPSRSPSLAPHALSRDAAPSAHHGEPCLFYEMGFCEMHAHPVSGENAQRGETESHLVGVASVVHQLLRDHQRLEQQCRTLEVRCNKQSVAMQGLQSEVDRLRRIASPTPSTSAPPPAMMASATQVMASGDGANVPLPAHPPLSRRESMYVQRLRERTHSAQNLYNKAGHLQSVSSPSSPTQLSVEAARTAVAQYAPCRPSSPSALAIAVGGAEGKVLADALHTPKSCGRGIGSRSGTRRSSSDGHASFANGISSGEGQLLGGTLMQGSVNHSSTGSELGGRSPRTHQPHCFPSYRQDDSLSSISQPSSDLLGTADEPGENELLQRMVCEGGTPPIATTTSLTAMAEAGSTHWRGVRPAKLTQFSPPSLSLISTTHRPAQFARAMGPLASAPRSSESSGGLKEDAYEGGKCVPSPTRSPTVTARDGLHGDDVEEEDVNISITSAQQPTRSPRSPAPRHERHHGTRPKPSLSPRNTSLGAGANMMTKTAVLQRPPTIAARSVTRTGGAVGPPPGDQFDQHSTSCAAEGAAPILQRLPRATSAAGSKLSARGIRAVCSQSNLKEFEKQQRQLEESQKRMER